MVEPQGITSESARQAPTSRAYRVSTHLRLVNGYAQARDASYRGSTLEPPEGRIKLGPVPLEGQEFLRFAGCTTEEQVAGFVRGFGTSGLPLMWKKKALEQRAASLELSPSLAVARQTAEMWPVSDLLELPSSRHSDPHRHSDPLEDLVREANVLRGLVDAYEITSKPAGIGSRVRVWRNVLQSQDPARVLNLPLIGPLARAGLSLDWDDKRECMSFKPRSLTTADGMHRFPRVMPSFIQPSREGLLLFIRTAMNPVVGLTKRGLELRGGQLLIVNEVPEARAMLPIMYLQAAVAFAERREIHECGWTKCKGPPSVQGQFLFKTRMVGDPEGDGWSWRSIEPPQRLRADDYCSPRCASAASSAAAASKRKRTQSSNEREVRRVARERRRQT
jgi:hypothetical protein